ncbi:uncharacterized protein LOC129905350 [Episyrphus balteatus]|uniref:uncharacterized protein LOC129905350 n=1 Tax=Episyrphus balteatus TaxID=286459 RepID=UPI002485FD39|nr:uncharacterized protein LOC129905350 [Episyrphus balteatus]
MNSFMRRNITAEQMHSFLKDKQAWENAIAMYNGPDPLEHWYNYICWYNSNIHGDPENKFRETLERCLTQYEHNEYYKQDPRMVKLWIKYIDLQPNPLHFYQILYQRGIGRQCACFYTNWAHYYDSANAFKEAESIYNLGFQAKAEPYTELEGAHTKFLYSLSQRMVYDDKKQHNSLPTQHQQQQQQQQIPISQPLEKRPADVGQHLHQQQQQQLQQQQHMPEQVQQHCHQQIQQQHAAEIPVQHQTQVQTPVVNTNCQQYTELQSSTATAISSSLNYIYNEPQVATTAAYPQDPAAASGSHSHSQPHDIPLGNVKLPAQFATYCRNNYEVWKPALFLEEPDDPYKRCQYQKTLVYPGGDIEFSPEEIRAKKWKSNQQKSRQQPQQPVVVQQTPSVAATPEQTHVVADIEDQIEASTIRFSTHEEHGVTKSKTIKIKFKKEKPSTALDSSSNSINGQNNYNYTIENAYATEDTASQDDGHHHNRGGNNNNGFHPYQMQTSTPKVKKPKKLKSVNKHLAGKYLSAATAHGDSNSSDYHPQQQSQYQYEEANLLLTFAKENTTSSSATTPQQLQHRTPIKIRQKNGDSVHYAANDNASFSFNETAYLDNSNCSVSSAVGRLNFRESQRDDFSTYAENSFFASENDKELQEQRLEKALTVIETHMAKPVIDPFNNELCKAFLTKLNFPSYDAAENVYKVVSTPLPKLANTKMITLADSRFSIEKEVGRGSYGSVYKATDCKTGTVVALKYQKPPNIWEIYICHQVRQRIRTETVLPGVMNISSAVIAPNASIIATEFSPYGSLLDINNKIRQATKKVMHESLVMHFSSQILNIIHCLHKSKIIHADIKPDNFLLMRVPNTDLHYPSLRLIDFGCALDMTLFPERTQFRKIIQTDGFTCIEMQEGRPWSYETDLFCVAGTVHVMLFGEYMQISKKFETWDIKQKLPRYLKKHVWTDFFGSMLNIKSQDILPNLLDIKMRFDEEAMKMDSELQSQIRTLSNLLHRR